MGKDKNKEQDGESTSAESITSPWDACHSNRDLSQEREAQDTALAKTITKAVAREMAKAHAHYQALFNERSAAVIPTSLKVTSGANGFKVMDPFDWTKDKAICQRWQLWSEKARPPLMLWKVTQKSLGFHISITGLTEREQDTLSHGKTTKSSSANWSMID